MNRIRTWDASGLTNKKVILTGKNNPYERSTIEYELVEYVMELGGKSSPLATLEYYLSMTLLERLKEKGLVIAVDTYNSSLLFWKAVWLAKSAGVIKLKDSSIPPRPQFAVFLEAGMTDLFTNQSFLAHVNKLTRKEHSAHIQDVLDYAQTVYKNLGVPLYSHQVEGNESTILIRNLKPEIFERMEGLPIQTWGFPWESEIAINSRGLFHHLGDEVSFIGASCEYGDCYVLGHNEFSELVVLGALGYKGSEETFYKVGDTLIAEDLTYIYGVPYTSSLYPTDSNRLFSFSNEEIFEYNKEKKKLSHCYWKTETFNKYAGRTIDELSVSELVSKIGKRLFKYLKEKHIDAKLHEMENSLCKLKPLTTQLQKLSEEIPYTGVKNLRNEIKRVFTALASPTEKELKDLDFAWVVLPNTDLSTIDHRVLDIFAELIIHTPPLMKVLRELKEATLSIDLQNVREETKFFYKSISQKVHCEIINEENPSECGFFLKNEQQRQKFLDTQLVFERVIEKALKYLLDDDTAAKAAIESSTLLDKSLEESVLEYLGNKEIDPWYYHPILDYWKGLGNKALLFSNVIPMENEYRIFVVGHRPVTASPCYRQSTPLQCWDKGRFNPYLCNGHNAAEVEENRARVSLYARFAKMFCEEMKNECPEHSNYVLDVAWSNGNVVAIEVNSIEYSGPYMIDMRRVCAAFSGQRFKKSEMVSLGNYQAVLQEARRSGVTIAIPPVEQPW